MLVLIYSIIISFCIGGVIFECKNDKYINEEIGNFTNYKKQEIKHIKEVNENQQKRQYLAYFVFLISQYFLMVYYIDFAIPHLFH